MSALGNFLERARTRHLKGWKIGFFIFLGLAVGANFFIHPYHAEFGLDAHPGFWAGFGLVIAIGMVFIMKKIIQPMLVRPEESVDAE